MPIDDVHTMIYIIVYNDIHHCIQWYTAIPLYHCIQLYIIVYSCISYNTAVHHTIYSYPIVSLYDIQLYTMIAMIYSCIQGQLRIIASTWYNGIAVYRISLYTDVFDLRCLSLYTDIYHCMHTAIPLYDVHAMIYIIVYNDTQLSNCIIVDSCISLHAHHCIHQSLHCTIHNGIQLSLKSLVCATVFTAVSPLHHTQWCLRVHTRDSCILSGERVEERWGAGVETQKNVRGEIGGWGRVPFNEPYAPLLRTIYDGA